ncbi:MAG: hypothetical protein JSS42_15165 [Proteobacteria bacterium]|nr:hypothetical protein [Pseudomonadota bacterium]
MQIPDQPVKRECTKSGSTMALRKSLQGASQLMLRAVGQAGIKFAPRFTKVRSGKILKARDHEASKLENTDACACFLMISIT